MSTTLKDVAKLAGVSIATVSYVLNNGPRPVSQDTRLVVEKAIDELGYEPRRKRKNQPTTDSLTIGVIVPHPNSTFFGEALEGIEEFLYSRNHTCIVCSSHSSVDIEKKLIRKLTKLVNGLIITPVGAIHPDIEKLPDMGIPVVVMDRQIPATNLSGVSIDNYSITVQAVKLFFDAGYEEIALITGPGTIDTMQSRLDGYVDTLEKLQLAYNPEWVVEAPFTADAGRNAVLELMSQHNPPQAIISTSTDMTAGILLGLNQLGVRIPDDVALVCYGDTIWTPLVTPAVTVIDAPVGLMGETSARLLLNSISDVSITETKHIFLEPTLIARDSHRQQRSLVNNAVS